MHDNGLPVWVFLIPIVMVVIGYAIAFSRKGSVRGTLMGGRRLDIRTPADPQAAFDRIRAMRGKFTADDSDPQAKIVVLASPVTFFSWGFMYPVYIHAEGAGSRIEIGIASKFIQIGPVVGKWHRDCVAAIEASLSVPTARVA
jgi:hypothetical protein